MKHLFDKSDPFKYTPSTEQGPYYLLQRMQEYRDRLKTEAEQRAKEEAEKQDKIVGTIKPRVKAKS